MLTEWSYMEALVAPTWGAQCLAASIDRAEGKHHLPAHGPINLLMWSVCIQILGWFLKQQVK